MAPKILPPREFVLEALDYNQETGEFRWRTRPPWHFPNQRICNVLNSRCAGKPAGFVSSAGYVTIRLRHNGGKLFQAHRLAWLLIHGEPIPAEIDHINGDPSDNRISNLRAADSVTNKANARRRSDNTTGVKGVSICRQTGMYRVVITHNGKHYRLPRFATLEEAMAARREAAERLHGEFARHE